jgi:hypothetical protein
MKPKILLFAALIAFLLCSLSVNAQTEAYNYSVKNRWTLKASYSRYKTAYDYGVFSNIGDFFYVWQNRKMSNFKVEANYGINKFIETGIYTGFQHYEWVDVDEVEEGEETPFRENFAPLFGVNINFHILPFLIKSNECRWDVYLTTKYGGCYLPHKENPDNIGGKYRQEYGLGMGVGYYFKNIIGIYAESSVGQFSYFPKYVESNFRFRIGIAAKINK